MKKIIIIFVLLIPTITSAEWTEEKIAREIAFLVALGNDWQQTLDIARNPTVYWEKNKIHSKHPKTRNVHAYMAACAVGHAVISYYLPDDYSKAWQVVWIGLQLETIAWNDNLGLNQNIGIEYRWSHSMPF